MSTPYEDGFKTGERRGREKAIKELAALESDPDSVARMSERLLLAEKIVDWYIIDFEAEAQGRRHAHLNSHVLSYLLEQKKLRGEDGS